MNRNKSRIVIIIIVLLVVLLAVGATFAILYMTTDLFKSDKTLFYKYIAQNEKIGQTLNMSELDAYIEKSKNTPHTYEGNITFNQSSSETPSTTDNFPINNLKIELSGKSDPTNKNESTDLKIKYEDENLFHISTIKNDDLYGVLSEEIITKYLAIKNNNLTEFASKLGIEDTSIIPNKIEVNQYDDLFTLTEEQKANIINIYKSTFMDNIPNQNYTRQKEVPLLLNNNNITTTTYSVILTQEQLTDLSIDLLNTSKESEVIINIIKEKAKILGYEDSQLDGLIQEYKNGVQNLIDQINSSEKNENNTAKIVLYTANKQLLKTEIIFNDKTTIGIVCEQEGTQNKINFTINEKESTNQLSVEIIKNATAQKLEFGFTFNIISDDVESKIVCKIEKNGSASATTIKDAASFGYNDGTTTSRVDYSMNEDYSDNINVEKLDSSNSVTLNDYPAEDIQNLMTALTNRLEQVIEEKIQLLQSKGIIFPGMQENDLEATAELTAFNSQFMAYSGSDVLGENVKTLITQVISSNTSYPNNQIIIEFDQYTGITDAETLGVIAGLIDSSLKYIVSTEYGLEGFINKIVIKQNV